jgi:hypothetical protein
VKADKRGFTLIPADSASKGIFLALSFFCQIPHLLSTGVGSLCISHRFVFTHHKVIFGGNMKTLIVGTGIIGVIYGWALSEAGVDVTHFVRKGRKEQFKDGITLDLLAL